MLKAEFLKMKGARIPRMCATGIAGFPILLALPLVVLNKLGATGDIMNGPSWKMFAEASLVFIVVFVGPVLLGLVATFLFAREFIEGTARNLFALPVSRTRVKEMLEAVSDGESNLCGMRRTVTCLVPSRRSSSR